MVTSLAVATVHVYACVIAYSFLHLTTSKLLLSVTVGGNMPVLAIDMQTKAALLPYFGSACLSFCAACDLTNQHPICRTSVVYVIQVA